MNCQSRRGCSVGIRRKPVLTRNTRLRVMRESVMRPALLILACLAAICVQPIRRCRYGRPNHLSGSTAGPPIEKDANAQATEKELTPEQKMQQRFPQPVRVGDLIGLPVLDDDDSTIGYVREVVRSPQGKVFLIVPYSAWFGWARDRMGQAAGGRADRGGHDSGPTDQFAWTCRVTSSTRRRPGACPRGNRCRSTKKL